MTSNSENLNPEIALTMAATVAAAKDQVSTELAGEMVVLEMREGVYFSLNPVGARIWKLIQEPKKVAEICETIIREYEVEPERCRIDTLALLKQLHQAHLIVVQL